jgi:hypothetical protein
MKFDLYIMASDPISRPYFIKTSHQSVSVCVSKLLGNGSVKKVTEVTNTHTIAELLVMSFSMRSMSYQRKVDDYFFPELFVNC